VGDFGCIAHTEYPFLGASPDGINVDENSPLFGRMIEVKNIVNRQIDGNPLEAYWIQMQLQMEVCGLDVCDFIETRFREFDTEIEYHQSGAEYKGVILYMVPRIAISDTYVGVEGTYVGAGLSPKYVYMPLDIPRHKSAADAWIDSQKREHAAYVVYRVIFWALDEFSCVTVQRNCEWFAAVLPKIRDCWDTIVRERVEGYDHRAATQRKRAPPAATEVERIGDTANTHYIKNLPKSKHTCLVKLDA
jgi:hypothetical protein